MVENNHIPAPDMMESLLQEIGLGNIFRKFKEEKVDIGVAMSATDEDLIKLGVRTIGQRVRLRGICRGRYYDFTNNITHGCCFYSYSTTNRPNTTSSIQTLGREERSFLFSPRSSGNNDHRSSTSRRSSSSTTTRKMLRKQARCSNLDRLIHVPV